MDKYAKRILKEQVAPKLDMLFSDKGISESELMHVKHMICIAKELLECDTMFKKLGMDDPVDYKMPDYKSDGRMSL